MVKLETLADSIAALNDSLNPDSEAYRLRNPGLLRSFALQKPQASTPEGIRIFGSYIGGYRALVHDLSMKCGGKSRAKLTPNHNLTDLMAAYGWRDEQPVAMVVDFLQRATGERSICATSLLKEFSE